MNHFSDRVLESIDRCGNGIVPSFDPWPDRLPREMRPRTRAGAARAVEAFGRSVLGILEGRVPAVKFQVACFEALGSSGMRTYGRLVETACASNLLVVADAKRSDIGATAQAYARAHLGGGLRKNARGPFEADALTVVPFFGEEGLAPFLDAVRRRGKGLFVMVRSSNPGANAVQEPPVAGRPWFLHLAELIRGWSEGCAGSRGMSDVGFVVGATQPEAVAAVLGAHPDTMLLLPGIGAQGGSVADVRAAAGPGARGLLFVVGRALLYAYRDGDGRELPDWRQRITGALDGFVRECAEAAP